MQAPLLGSLARAALFILLLPLSAALFPDEAYHVDFQHSLLGLPFAHNTFFHQPTASSKASLLYTLSEKLVLGAVNPRDGTLVWRQDLAERPSDPHTVRGFLKAAKSDGAVVSAAGTSVRSWDAASGRLIWQWAGDSVVKSLEVLDWENEPNDAIALVQGVHSDAAPTVVRNGAEDGEVVWKAEQSIGEIPVAVTSSSTAVFYISLVPGTLRGYKIKVTTLNAATGKQNAQIQLSSESEVTDAKSIVHVGSRSSYPIIVWADLTRKTVKANVLGSKSVTTLRVHPEDRIRRATIHAADDRNVPGHFVLHCQTDTRSIASVYLVEDTKVPDRPSHVWELESENAAYAASTVMNEIYFTRHTPSEIAIHSAKSSKPVQTWTIGTSLSEAQEPNGLTQAVIEVAVRAGGKYAMRAGVLYASGDWELTRDGKPQWVRNEGLAGVKAATWAELPNRQDLVRELEVESHTNIVSAYIHRVRRHVNGLSQLQEWARNIPKRIWTSFTGQTLGGQDDGFGFGQVVIAATEKGRVFALDGGRQGAVRWSVLAKPLEDCAVWNITGINVNGTLVTVTAAGGEAVILEVESGKIRERQASGLLPNVRSLVSVNAGLGKNFLMPLSDDGVPMDALKENVGNSTYLVTQRADGSISGWYLASGRSLTPAWTFRPPSGEAVSVATSRPAHDPVASIGRALGDRNVLYKFLSPNLLLVLTSNTALATLTAYLLDSVTGRTLHSTTHHSVDTTEPISATMSENWLAYTFSTDPSLGTVQGDIAAPKAHLLTLSELYESPAPNSRGPLGDSNNVSSLTSPVYSPYVLSSTHVLPAALTHLTTSSTLQGITPRTILAYCPAAAAVFALPYHPFSPRRPRHRDATPEEREEGLLRDHAAMDLFPHWSLSHAREVLGVERVVAAPTRMESSTLVLAFGQLDLFATREAPIGAFDVLDRGFGRWAMVGTVLALAVGTAALAPMVRRKQVSGLWGG